MTITRSAAVALLVLCCGCEVNSTEDDIEIEPGSVALSQGQSHTFTVYGGHDYAWSLEPDDGSASLSVRHGNTTVFTLLSSASSTPANPSAIAVICTSTIPGVTGSGTNAADGAYVATDTAYVHIAPP